MYHNNFIRSVLILFLLLSGVEAQQSAWDTLNIQYEIISRKFEEDKDIIKIKVPPYLSTLEIMDQIKLAIQWPGDPPPKNITLVYVFKETDKVGDTSKTGVTFVPGKGYLWSLKEWKPVAFPLIEPTLQEKIIYNTLLDSLFAHGLTTDNMEVKNRIAKQFDLTVAKLDSIYLKVKYWKSH